jgi:hypothetical protein
MGLLMIFSGFVSLMILRKRLEEEHSGSRSKEL